MRCPSVFGDLFKALPHRAIVSSMFRVTIDGARQ
jgi:hypothetical protein